MNLDASAQVDEKLLTPWRKLLVTVHVLTTVGVFGADLVLLTLGTWSALGAEPGAVYPAAAIVGQILVAPLAISSLGTGVALALLTPWGLLKYWWTTIKLTITVVLTVVVLLVLVPRLAAAAHAARANTPHTFTAEERTPLLLAPVVASSLLALNVALAIYKPRWRVRRDAGELRQTGPSYA